MSSPTSGRPRGRPPRASVDGRSIAAMQVGVGPRRDWQIVVFAR